MIKNKNPLNLRFSHKILLLPILSGMAFLLVILILNVTANQTDRLLTEIYQHSSPAAELGQDLQQKLLSIQRSLQDAADAMDIDLLVVSDAKFSEALSSIRLAHSTQAISDSEEGELERAFQRYYTAARKATAEIISTQMQNASRPALAQMQKEYQAVKAKVDAFHEAYEAKVAEGFQKTKLAHQKSVKTTTSILVVSVSILAFLSWMINLALSHQIRRASDIAREIADGKEVSFRRTKKDELGELLKGLQEMAEKVQARTLELKHQVLQRKEAQEELEKARDAAEAANRAKSEFLANMSHEIRTPINGIMGMIDLTLQTKLAREQKEFLGLAKLSADSLLTVINDILDFSKIEAKKLTLESNNFNLHEDLSDIASLMAPRAFEKKLELACSIAPDVPQYVVGDPARLRQIILNLVGNAIKFTETGEVVVAVSAIPMENAAGNVHLQFTVTDTGIGIAPDKQRFIFDPFRQGDGSTTRRYGGTGLGLTISSQLAQMMGGKIRLESEPGRGSRFYFDAVFGIGSEIAARSMTNTDHLTDLPVLVVDDNSTNRLILENMLRNWRMKPKSVAGGQAALEALSTARLAGAGYRLLLIDAEMPEMDGFELAQRIRKTPGLSGTIVLMLSSAGSQADERRRVDSGIDTYLAKPVRQSDLLDAIMDAMNPSPAGQKASMNMPPIESSPEKLNILVAEDNLINQKLVTKLLQKHGHNVTVAVDGKEAVSAFVNESFDLILMDVQMPEMNGFEASQAIRNLEDGSGQHTPIIAVTAHALKGDREKCLSMGMDDYLSKPIQEDKLIATISLWAKIPAAQKVAPPAQEETLPQFASDSELFAEMVEALRLNAPSLLKRIQDAIGMGDAETIRIAAHTAKGSLSNFGKNKATRTALKIEEMARNQDLRTVNETCQELAQDVEHLISYLSNALAPAGAAAQMERRQTA